MFIGVHPWLKRLEGSDVADGQELAAADVLQFNRRVLAAQQITRRAGGRAGIRGVNLTEVSRRHEPGSIRRRRRGNPIPVAVTGCPGYARIGGGINPAAKLHGDEPGSIRRGGDEIPIPAAVARHPIRARIA